MKKASIAIIIPLTIIIVLAFFVLFINRSLIMVRVYELSQSLEEINNLEQGRSYMDILFKYEMNRRLYTGKISEEILDVEELKIISSASLKDGRLNRLEDNAKAVLPLVNTIRFVLGKPYIIYNESGEDNLFDIAYYYERNGYLKKAIELYDSITNPPQNVKPLILLHKGYCHALTGNIDKAEKKLTTIIKDYSRTDVAITAATLLMHIRDFRVESENILRQNNPSLENSIKLLQLTSFENAFDMLSRLESHDDDTEAVINYYKARYYEETGDKNKAIEIYQNIILNNHQSETAARSNRRIFLVSLTQTENEAVRNLVNANNELIKDEIFERMRDLEKEVGRTNLLQIELPLIEIEKIEEYTSKVKIVVENLNKVEKKTSRDGNYSLSYFTKDGEISKIENFDRRGNITGYYLYIYDNAGNRIRIDAYDKNGKLMEYY